MGDPKKSALKAEIESDVTNVFMNEDDFAEEHFIDGKSVMCVLSSDMTLALPGGYSLGISDSQLELFVAAEALPTRKKPGQHLMVDTTQYVVDAWSVDMGLAHIRLSRAQGI